MAAMRKVDGVQRNEERSDEAAAKSKEQRAKSKLEFDFLTAHAAFFFFFFGHHARDSAKPSLEPMLYHPLNFLNTDPCPSLCYIQPFSFLSPFSLCPLSNDISKQP